MGLIIASVRQTVRRVRGVLGIGKTHSEVRSAGPWAIAIEKSHSADRPAGPWALVFFRKIGVSVTVN